MSEALKERKEMDPQYQWDLTKMYASDAEWEKAFAAIDPKIEALAAWEGKLNNAASIREFYDAEIGVFRELENLGGNDDALKIAVLEQSILNAWQGVFALKGPVRAGQAAGQVLSKNMETSAAVLAARQQRRQQSEQPL